MALAMRCNCLADSAIVQDKGRYRESKPAEKEQGSTHEPERDDLTAKRLR
jgi:hypothetical protein